MAQESILKVFYCKAGHEPITIVRLRGPVVCKECSANMIEIGWMEND